MCIYLLDKEDLTYYSQDHVIQAAFGGIRKLPRGYVSDQFNNCFSLLELNFARNSIMMFPRVMEGPGKRGDLSWNKKTKSKVILIETPSVKKSFSLAYVSEGKPVLIPHLLFNSGTKKLDFSPNQESSYTAKTFENFIDCCRKVNSRRVKILEDERLPEGIIMFGYQSKVEDNFDAFVYKNKAYEFTFDDWHPWFENDFRTGDLIDYITFSPKITLTASLDEKYYRVFAKMAFNFLALITGEEYVKGRQFDDIRKWIVNGGENKYLWFNQGEYEPLKPAGITFENSEHSICILGNDHGVFAFLGFYGKDMLIVQLSHMPLMNMPFSAFICDWKNKREYPLSEYYKMITANNKF